MNHLPWRCYSLARMGMELDWFTYPFSCFCWRWTIMQPFAGVHIHMFLKVSIFQLRLISSNPHEFHHNTKQKFNPQKWHLTPPQNVSLLPGRLLALALRESFVVPLPLAVQNSVGELEIIRKIVGGWNFTCQIDFSWKVKRDENVLVWWCFFSTFSDLK